MATELIRTELTETDRAVLWAVNHARESTRAEIGRLVGVSKPTVGTSIAALENANLVSVVRSHQGSLGRAAAVYAISATAGWVLGVSVEAEAIWLAAVSLRGDLLLQTHQVIDGSDPAVVKHAIRAEVSEVQNRIGATAGNLCAVGVALERVIPRFLTQLSSTRPGFINRFELIDSLGLPPEIPVLVENATNCAAIAELELGAADVDDFVYLHVGAKIGAGIVTGRRVLRGANGGAGEISFLPVSVLSAEKPPHHDLERYLGSVEVLARVTRTWTMADGTPPASIDELFSRAEDGHRGALAGLVNEAEGIARAALAIAAVVDPALIVLDGDIGRRALIVHSVQDVVAEEREGLGVLSVQVGSLGEAATVTGAAAIAHDHAIASLVGQRYERNLHQGVVQL
ncbi:MAG: ROK family transcriptional regulator [Propionicimonas sp.]|nr:ROK family transcriptional regulator [Propionicimonas sp.]